MSWMPYDAQGGLLKEVVMLVEARMLRENYAVRHAMSIFCSLELMLHCFVWTRNRQRLRCWVATVRFGMPKKNLHFGFDVPGHGGCDADWNLCRMQRLRGQAQDWNPSTPSLWIFPFFLGDSMLAQIYVVRKDHAVMHIRKCSSVDVGINFVGAKSNIFLESAESFICQKALLLRECWN